LKYTILIFLLFIIANNSYAQRVSAGGRHSLSICADSTVQAWGYNGYGQLGNGNIDEQNTGTQVAGLLGVVQVAGGLFHSLFVKSDGTAWSCGRNTLGTLGDGTNDNKTNAVQVNGLTNIIQAAGGGEHSLFLRSDGTVWACGNNSSGQLGDGTSANKNSPVQVNGLSDIIQIAAGAEFSLFLKNDGTVWACGHNGYGQFGNGTNKSSNVPVMISGLSDIIQLSAGEWHSLFVKNDGTVFSSGRNQYGQLGDGTTVDKSTASLIATLSGVTQAEAGGIHSVFLNSNGSVFACGLNSGGNNDGQLGDGTAIDRHTPVEVAASWGSGTIIRVEATREHSLFLHSDGLLWAAGRNNYGQLGYGKFTTPNSSTPVRSSTVCNALPTSVTAVAQVENEIQVFPNPSSGILYITSERPIVHVEVINIIGGTVFLLSNLNERYSAEIDISDKPSGVYFLRITDLDKRVIAKGILLP
jgi:alpha-tubulin suppressor-like RCC1 family protein